MKKSERDELLEALGDSMILILLEMGNACAGDGTTRAAAFYGQSAWLMKLVHGEDAAAEFLDTASGGHYSSYQTLRSIGFDHESAQSILSGQVMEDDDE